MKTPHKSVSPKRAALTLTLAACATLGWLISQTELLPTPPATAEAPATSSKPQIANNQPQPDPATRPPRPPDQPDANQPIASKPAVGLDVIDPVTRADNTGRAMRHRIMHAKFKYPLIQGEEPADGKPTANAMDLQNPRVADHLIVKMIPGKTDAENVNAMAAELGMTVRRRIGNTDMYLVSYDIPHIDSQELARAALAARPEVVFADYDGIASIMATPNDPQYDQLWGMPKISAPEAWDVSTGSHEVVVGVIDTGIDYNHPDLAANIWTNPGEMGFDDQGRDKRFNGIDDDGSGYVDDWRGWNFAEDNNDPMDVQSHGTHVAGTIGAIGNNGIGVAGVCWQVSLVALKGLNDFGFGAYSDLAAALMYAADMGFDMTSNSWGGGQSDAIEAAMDYVENRGQLVIAAAGNSNADNDTDRALYPASYPNANIISVMSTGTTDQRSSWSNYGATTVDLAAPGENILSSVPGGEYDSYDGTSMATPHVAGACALLKALNPSLTTAQLKSAVMDGVDVLPNLAGNSVTGGRLNILKSMQLVADPVPSVRSFSFAEAVPGDGHLNPGEEAVGTVALVNHFGEPFQNVVAELTTDDPSITILSDTVNYGTLGTGQTSNGDGTFRIQMAVGASPRLVSLTLTITSSDGGPWTYPLTCAYVNSTAISGYVRSAVGGVISNAKVSWTGTSAGQVTSGSDGYYAIPAVDGTYAVVAFAPGFISNAPENITVPPYQVKDLILDTAGLQITPAALTVHASQGKTVSGGLDLASVGSLPVHWTLSTDEYRFDTSNDPGGPAFVWNDISTTGSLIAGFGDDTNLGPFPLGFTMPFYGKNFTSVRICSNGWLSFTSTAATFFNDPLPSTWMPENLIAPLMRDLDLRYAGSVHYMHPDSETFVVQFTNVPLWLGPTTLCTFQAVLKSDGTILYYYQRVDEPDFGTVGIQDETRTIGLNVAFDEPFLHSGLAVRIQSTPKWLTLAPTSGTIAPGFTGTITATCNTATLQVGTYETALSIKSNDTLTPSRSVPLTLVVEEGPVVTEWPMATGIGYGQLLFASTLTGGSASVPGSFAFVTPETMLTAGTHDVPVLFTPTDTEKYISIQGSTSVVVAKAPTTVSTWPRASGITDGQYLSASTLIGGAASIPGFFAFADPLSSFVGTDSFTFRVSDGDFISDPATVSITVGDDVPAEPASIPEPESAPFANASYIRSDGATVVTFASGNGSWTVPERVSRVEVLVVGGGGGGGASFSFSNAGSGGGGAGGLIHIPEFTVTANHVINYAVGAGGAPATSGNTPGTNGADSVFGSLTALGGGGGAGGNMVGKAGGSGGGSRIISLEGGAGLQPFQSGLSGQYGHGHNGGAIDEHIGLPAGGGGGANAAGNGTTGGAGRTIAITGQNSIYAGGGGGGGAQNTMPGNGGAGGGGRGANYTLPAIPGSPNTGGGGGGGNDNRAGATGGSGIIIIAYHFDNHPPLANAQSVTVAANTPQPIQLTGSDPDGDMLTFSIVTPPAFGTLSGTPPSVVYTPPPIPSPGFHEVSVIFTPDNQNFQTVIGTVHVSVLDSSSPYGVWTTNYPGHNLNDPSADHDGDGLSNFNEFAFGLDPTSGASSNPITKPFDVASRTFRYSRTTNSGLAYTISFSQNLRDWLDLPPDQWSEHAVTSANDVEIIEVTLSSPLPPNNLFIRVKAE